MPEITIIIPVYNVEDYLSKCLDSILAQTFNDFECILIDDGSTDNSGKICDKYAKKDDRMIVIHQKNSGPSSARNAGLDKAGGEWIGFVDSDDWCDNDMFSRLYENSIRNNADVSVCGWKRIYKNKIITYAQEKEYIYNSYEAVNAMLSNKYFDGYIWNKLIRARFFTKYNIRFDINIKPFEETLVLFRILKIINKAVYSPVPCYNYNINPDSITNKSRLTWVTALPAFEKMISLETSEPIKHKILLKKIEMVSFVCYAEITSYKDSAYCVFSEIANKHFFHILFLLKIPLKDRISRCLCLLHPGTYIILQRKYRQIKQSVINRKNAL
jgi:glycosyltransferase involved in cell wall biosynthesis